MLHFSEMCLDQALTIHMSLIKKMCPYKYLESETEPIRCQVLCRGTSSTKATDPSSNCVAYNISFYLNETLLSKLLDFRCGIPRCILELIAFECTLSGKNVGVYSYETSSKKDEPKDTNCENDLSHDPDTRVVISLSCFFGGSLIGIGVLVILKRFKTFKRILQPPPVFYQPNTRVDENLSREITVAIGSRLETGDNEDTIRKVAKAIQVLPYKEDSPFETSSRENCSDPTNDTSKETNSAVVSSDFISDSFVDDIIPFKKSCPSFKNQ